MGQLETKRALVVGASSGIGRACALAIVREGASVAVAARRLGQLEELAAAAEPLGRCVPFVCDVRDPTQCEAVVDGAARALGGLDLLVYASGISPLAYLRAAGPDTWKAVIETNLIGAALVTRAALRHLPPNTGRALYLSSTSASVTAPWPGLGPYVVSKAGLDKLVEALRCEHPEIGFIRVVVGPTLTGFADGWDPELAQRCLEDWAAKGLLGEGVLEPEAVAERVVAALAAPGPVESLLVAFEPAPPHT